MGAYIYPRHTNKADNGFLKAIPVSDRVDGLPYDILAEALIAGLTSIFLIPLVAGPLKPVSGHNIRRSMDELDGKGSIFI